MSRKHATVSVNHSEANIGHPHIEPELHLTDTSKLGTMLNNQRFVKKTKVVKSGSAIMFGTGGESTFQAIYEPYLVTSSTLDAAGKRTLKSLIVQLGGHLVNDWRKECNLLVMTSLSVTIKVICALIAQKNIVTPKYLQDLVDSMEAKTKSPDPHDYIPNIAESQLNPNEVSFKQNPSRKTIFEGKIFIFLTPKQFKKLSVAVELGGGTPMLMEEGSEDEEDLLTATHTCVMLAQPDPSQMSQNAMQWVGHVLNLLQRHNRRAIDDSELGYAVLFASTERYCNPLCPHDNLPFPGRNVSSQTMSQTAFTESQRNTPGRGKRKLSESESVQSVPFSKSRKLGETPVIEIKPEPLTPKPKSQRGDGANTPSTSRRSKKSPSPAPASPSPRRSPRCPSPAPPSPAGRRRKTSPAPAARKSASPSPSRKRRESPCDISDPPARSSRGRRQKSPVTEELDDLDFDSIPTRRTARGTDSRGRRDNRNDEADDILTLDDIDVSPICMKDKESDKEKVKSSKNQERGDMLALDDFDAIPSSRKSKAQNTSQVAKNSKPIDLDDFDALPARRSEQRSKPVADDLLDDDLQIKTETVLTETLHDDFDNLPSRRNRKRGAGTAPVKKEDINILDDFDALPTRNTKRDTDIGDGIRDDDDARRNKRSKISVKKMDRNDATVKTKDDSTLHDTDEDMIADTSRVRVAERKVGDRQTRAATSVSNSGDFLTTSKPLGDQVTMDIVQEESDLKDVKPGMTEVEECSLLARKPGEAGRKAKSAADCNTWKGRVVKNFKKFKKCGKAAAGLPRIIGGSDLVVHQSKITKDIEELFKDSIEADHQHSLLSKETSNLFDWNPPEKRKRGKR